MISKSILQAMHRRWIFMKPTDISIAIIGILDSHLEAVTEIARLQTVIVKQGKIIAWFENECDEDHQWSESEKPPSLQELYDELEATESVKEKNDGSTDHG